MTISVGDKLPNVKLKKSTASGPADTTTAEEFGGKKVALFAVPGAFTPTCSAKHLPSFVNNAAALKAKGIDLIACVAVNDVFVMGAWGKDQKVADKLVLLADGNAEFTKAIGLELDGSGFGLGTRSKRYAMILDNLTVKDLFIEAPGAFEVSSAEHMLAKL